MSERARAEFDEWYFRRYGQRDLTDTWQHAIYQDAFEVWQASRATLVIKLPKAATFTNREIVKSVGRSIIAQGYAVKLPS